MTKEENKCTKLIKTIKLGNIKMIRQDENDYIRKKPKDGGELWQ